MCGLTGVLTGRLPPADAIRRMTDSLYHRGPDDGGTWMDEQAGVALGFRRLAIIDLSVAGCQPMHSACDRYVLVFNGEIYNHLELRETLRAGVPRTGGAGWRGHSDTETLLACIAEWGVPLTLERAVGMFAFALWDRAERRLCLARDRFGEKPLYYGWTQGAFVFGSELKALRQYPGFDNPVDRDVLALYAQYCYVPTPYSIYRHVYKLQPGCFMFVAPDAMTTPPERALTAPTRRPGLVISRYWSFLETAHDGLANPIVDEREAVERLHDSLSEAVRLQSIADVPLGAFLSGGIDSTTIVALMQSLSNRKVKTLTIGFDEEGYNEARHAKAIAAHLGTDHSELYVSVDQARELIPCLPSLYSEPFADSSQIPTHLVSKIARSHVTVALSGDGGDELFGGYRRYTWARRIWNSARLAPPALRRSAGAAMQQVPVPAWDRMSMFAPGLARVGDRIHKLGYRLERVSSVDELYQSLVTEWPPEAALVPGARQLPTAFDEHALSDVPDPEHRMMIWDTLTYLPDDILHKVDRAAMGVSLETRVPFLDHRVAQLAWRLPLQMKIRHGVGKWAVRQLLYRYVPQTLVERPKMGFGIPLDTWLRGPLREWAEDLLAPARLRADGFFDPSPVRRAWEEHLSGRRNRQQQLWALLMFQAWTDHRDG
jgi:asparagine synthase (glutamine-hydrolysing)